MAVHYIGNRFPFRKQALCFVHGDVIGMTPKGLITFSQMVIVVIDSSCEMLSIDQGNQSLSIVLGLKWAEKRNSRRKSNESNAE
jgi:hypothetical protein